MAHTGLAWAFFGESKEYTHTPMFTQKGVLSKQTNKQIVPNTITSLPCSPFYKGTQFSLDHLRRTPWGALH